MIKLSKEEFGKWLRKTRTEAGFTLRKFCLAIGKSPTYLSRIERGDFDPPAEETLKTIARTLNLNEDEILAMVGKISSDLVDIITKHPVEIAYCLRNNYHLQNNKIISVEKV